MCLLNLRVNAGALTRNHSEAGAAKTLVFSRSKFAGQQRLIRGLPFRTRMSPGIPEYSFDDALCEPEHKDPRKTKLIETGFFGGLTAQEPAEIQSPKSPSSCAPKKMRLCFAIGAIHTIYNL